MKFHELHERLRLETWRRIDLGSESSALLARQTGLAQAHISNFLHRRRRLSLTALDRILQAQALSVEDLVASEDSAFPPPEGNQQEDMDLVPIVSQSVAMTAPAISARAITDRLGVPGEWLTAFPVRRAITRRNWERFVAVRVTAAQAVSMEPMLRVGSVAVLDRHYTSLAPCRPPRPNVYGVRVGGKMAFRHVSFESSRLVLRPRSLEYPVEVVELGEQESPSDLLVGRVCLCLSEW
jgi:transcriptional regulator with XRE-family HTH domain